MRAQRCRSRHPEFRLQCELNRDHPQLLHRAEPGPTPIATETNRVAPMVTWSTPTY